MIPEQYWRLLGHWWWLIVIFFLLGVFGVNFVYQHARFNTFQSEISIEITHVNNTDGTSSFEFADRQLEANRLARELEGPWLSRLLMNELVNQNIRLGQGRLVVNVEGPRAPGRRGTDLRPSVIRVSLRHPNRDVLLRVAPVASQVYSEYTYERQKQFLDSKKRDLGLKVEQLELDFRTALVNRREALNTERDTLQVSLQNLFEAHDLVLEQLPVLLDDFRRQVALTLAGLNADPSSLDQSIISLRGEIELLEAEWLQQVRPTMATLYAVEAQPEVQLASVKLEVMRPEFQESFETLRTLEYNADPNVVVVLEQGTTPHRVSTLGIGRRYILVLGVVMGLVAGWILANLGEFLLVAGAKRKTARRDLHMQEEFAHQSD